MKTTPRRDRTHDRLRALCSRLYDSATPAAERRDLSDEISMLRWQIGALNIDQLSAASCGEEEC